MIDYCLICDNAGGVHYPCSKCGRRFTEQPESIKTLEECQDQSDKYEFDSPEFKGALERYLAKYRNFTVTGFVSREEFKAAIPETLRSTPLIIVAEYTHNFCHPKKCRGVVTRVDDSDTYIYHCTQCANVVVRRITAIEIVGCK